jgi:putative solute:sodium symporter small subunit
METAEYKFNFFKPKTDHGKANTKIIISMVAIWAVAVFGFQFLLKAIEKPTKEKSLIAFEQVWGNVAAGTATLEEKQTMAISVLAVLGKTVKKEQRAVLVNALNWSVYSLTPEVTKADAAQQLGVGPDSLEAKLLAITLSESRIDTLESSSQEQLPGIMSLYCTHNQSVLTDTKFLGFPFHYWYTAEFLLILFVGLCLVYCILIDRIHKKFHIKEDV